MAEVSNIHTDGKAGELGPDYLKVLSCVKKPNTLDVTAAAVAAVRYPTLMMVGKPYCCSQPTGQSTPASCSPALPRMSFACSVSLASS